MACHYRTRGPLLAFLLSVACSSSSPPDGQAVARASIVGGTHDEAHTAVAALVRQGPTGPLVCSGTTIGITGAVGLFLTAAHCVVATDQLSGVPRQPVEALSSESLFVTPGNDWLVSWTDGPRYPVLSVTLHPRYDGTSRSLYDIATLRYARDLDTDAELHVLGAAQDDLSVGSDIVFVGYGLTDLTTINTDRFLVTNTVSELSQWQFLNQQLDGHGTCAGDSGGPALYAKDNVEWIAGVVAYGDPACAVEGVSTRVSASEAFLAKAAAELHAPLSCQDCTIAASAPTHPCAASNDDDTVRCLCDDACRVECMDTPTCRARAGGQGGFAGDPAMSGGAMSGGAMSGGATNTEGASTPTGGEMTSRHPRDSNGCALRPWPARSPAAQLFGMLLLATATAAARWRRRCAA